MATQFGGLLGGWPRPLTPEEEELERQRLAALQAPPPPPPAPVQFEMGAEPGLSAEAISEFARQQTEPVQPLPSEQPLSSRMQDVARVVEALPETQIARPDPKPSVKIAQDNDFDIEMDDDDRPAPAVVAKDDKFVITLEDILDQPLPKPAEGRSIEDRAAETRAAGLRARQNSITNTALEKYAEAGRQEMKRANIKDVYSETPEEKRFGQALFGYVNTPDFNTKKLPSAEQIVAWANQLSEEKFGGKFTGQWDVDAIRASVTKRNQLLADPRYKGANEAKVLPINVMAGRKALERDPNEELPNEPRMWQRGFGLAPTARQELEDARNADGTVNVNKANRPDVGATDVDNLMTTLQAGAQIPKAGMIQALPLMRREFVKAVGTTMGGLGQVASTAYNAIFDSVAGDIEDRIRETGAQMGDKASQIMAQADPGYERGTAKYYAFNGVRAGVELAQGIAVSLATGSPTAGALVIATRVFGQTFNDDIKSGMSEDAAGRHATIMMLAELLPERTVIGQLMDNAGKSGLKRVIQGGLGEAAQEDITETISIGYDLAVFKKDMSLNEIADRYKDATILGFGTGGAAGAAVKGKYTVEERARLEEYGRRIAELNRVEQEAKAARDGGQQDMAQQPPAQEDIDVTEARPVAGMKAEGPAKRVRPTAAPVDAEGRVQTFKPPEGTPTSRVGPRKSFRTENGAMASSFHKGTDYGGMKLGAPVLAGADGVVLDVQENAGGHGKRVILGFSDGTTASYSHNSSIKVVKGQQVKQDDVIARAGKTGNTTGVHIHLELKDRKGNILDPATGKPITVTVGGSQRVPVVKDDTAYNIVYEEPGKELETDYDPVAMDDAWETYTGTRFEAEEEAAPPQRVATEVAAPTAPPAAPAPTTLATEPSTLSEPRQPDARPLSGQPLSGEDARRPGEDPFYESDEQGNWKLLGYTTPGVREPRFLAQPISVSDPYDENAQEEPLATQQPAVSTVEVERREPEPLTSQEPIEAEEIASAQRPLAAVEPVAGAAQPTSEAPATDAPSPTRPVEEATEVVTPEATPSVVPDGTAGWEGYTPSGFFADQDSAAMANPAQPGDTIRFTLGGGDNARTVEAKVEELTINGGPAYVVTLPGSGAPSYIPARDAEVVGVDTSTEQAETAKAEEAAPDDLTNRPLAANGLTSYRYKGPYGWVMIGASDTADALNEARRSVERADSVAEANLQVWDGEKYVDAAPASQAEVQEAPDPRVALLATLPQPPADAAPAVAAARLRGQEAGLGLVKPENLKSKSAAYKTAYNLGRTEAQAALQRSEAVEEVATEEPIVEPANDPDAGSTPVATEGSTVPMRGQVIMAALSNIGDKGKRLDRLVARGLEERGFIETDENGTSRLTESGRAAVAASDDISTRIDKADDRLFDIENDGNKGSLRAFVKKQVKEGVLSQEQADAYEYLFKDKDMGVEDIASEIRTDLQLNLQDVVEGATGAKYSRGRGQPYDPDRRAKLDALLRDKGPEILAKIDAEVQKMGLVGRADLPTIELVGRFATGEQGSFEPATLAIKISALDAVNPAGVTRHEVMHWARDRGVFNETEWNILAKWAKGQPGLMKWARTTYDHSKVPPERRLTADEIVEEAVAEGFSRIMRGEAEMKAMPIIERLLDRMGKIVSMAREFFDRSGVLKADREAAMELFESLYSGQQIKIADARGMRDINDRGTRVRESRTAPLGARLGDAPVPNPGIFRRMSQAALFGLTRFGAIGTPDFNTIKPDTTDTLGAAIERKLIQKYRQVFSVQGQGENFLGYPMPEEADLRGAIVADERGYRLALLRDTLVIPMAKEIHERGVNMTDLGNYLYARHAEARNIRVAAENKEFNLTDKPGSGMRTDVARQILADFAANGKEPDLAAVADYVDRIIDFARDEKISARLLTPTDIANGFKPGDKFVPLRGHDTEPEHEYNFGAGTSGGNGGFSTKGKESPTMYGRSSMADPEQIIGNVIALATSSVVRSYEARVGQKALKMFQLMAANGLSEPRFVQIDPVTRRAVWVKDNSPQGGHVEYQMQRRLDPTTQEPYTLFVKQDGQEYAMVFDHSNPSAVRMVKALKNLDPKKFNLAMRVSGLFVAWTRFSNTQASPVFIATNPIRDVQTGLVNASSLKIPGLRRAMFKNLIKAGPLIGAFRNSRRGKGDKSAVTGVAAEWVRIAEEADKNGGLLNYAQSLPMEAAIIDLQNAVKDAGRRKLNPKRMANATVRGIETFTSATENMTRLAAYKALRDKGVPAKKAAEKVRELTTNFSQHGEWGPGLSMMYAFANANIIGNMRTMGTFIAKPSTFAGLVSLGASTAVINGIFGEDEDDPDATRYSEEELDKMIVIPTKGLIGFNLTPPVGYGINVPITIGRKLAEFAMGKKNEDGSKMTPMDVASAITHSIATAFNPISGQNWLAMAAPSILDIPAAFVTNENWFGNPIYKEQLKNGTPVPASERMWRKTEDSWWAAATMAINDWTNGADDTGVIAGLDISPDGAKYVADQLMGGLGRTIWRSIEMPLDSKDDEWTDFPLFKPFFRTPGGSLTKEDQDFNNFRERMEKLDEIKRLDDELHLRGSKGIPEFNADNKAALRMIDPKVDPETGKDIPSAFTEASKFDKQLTNGMSALRKARFYVSGFKDEKQRNAVAKAAGVSKSSLPVGQKLDKATFEDLRARIQERQNFLAEEFNRDYREQVLEGED